MARPLTGMALGDPAAEGTLQSDSLAPAPRATPAATPALQTPPGAASKSSPGATSPSAPNLLPFAHNDIPASYPAFGVAIGMTGYLARFSEVDQAFRAIEDSYGAAGYTIPPASAVNPGPMLLGAATIQFNRWCDVACQVGYMGESGNEVTLIGGLLLGRATLPRARSVSLFAGLGGGSYGFEFGHTYGAQVSPVDSLGGYYALEQVTLEGGGGYWTTAGGVTFRIGPHGALDAVVQYLGMDAVTAETQFAGPVSVNLSGVLVGASFTIFF